MKRRGFLKGLLAAGALGLTLSAGSVFRLEASALPEPTYSALETDAWRKILAETMAVTDSRIRSDRIYEPTEWIIAKRKFVERYLPHMLPRPWYQRIFRRG